MLWRVQSRAHARSHPDPLSDYRSPVVEVLLDAERTAAAAASSGIRIIELEAGAMEPVDVIHLGTVHVKQAGLIDKNLQAFEIEDGVALIVEGFIESHFIGKTGATAPNHLDAKPGVGLGLFCQDLSNFFFGLLC